LQAPNAKVWLPSILAFSDSLNLPSANDLLQQAPSKSVWKRVVSGIIHARAKTNLYSRRQSVKFSLHLLSQMDQCPGTPSPRPIWTITHNKDLLHLTSKTNFRVRLLLGCHGLETDAACFQKRKGDLEATPGLHARPHPLYYMPALQLIASY